MLRNAIVALALITVTLPQSASAKTVLGTLRHGGSDIQFVLAGNQLIVEQEIVRGVIDEVGVPLKSATCPQVAGHTLTIHTRGAAITHATSHNPYDWVSDPKRKNSVSFVYDPSQDGNAGALLGKLDSLIGCR